MLEDSRDRLAGEAHDGASLTRVTQPGDLAAARERGGVPPAWYAAGLAIVAALVIAGLIAWIAVLLTRDNGVGQLATRSHVAATLQARDVGGGGVVLFYPDEKKALVVGHGIAPLNPAQATYQLWQVDAGQAKSIGFMQVDQGGYAMTAVPFEGKTGEILSISVEPPGGSEKPTSQPVFAAEFGTTPD